jgi:hypothetical protein
MLEPVAFTTGPIDHDKITYRRVCMNAKTAEATILPALTLLNPDLPYSSPIM